ncbi:MAG: 1,2-phenylacetyl-CoA epoxidase, subunit D [Cytophagales bacterium]|jgi:ring-1,2-phenylacetyl-CoA epoxidase subunit PaaD|nr:phenylacetate-CoA oxygenase subunit PaaJ [Bacteroidota bacterium]MBS1979578.1 phenylacetate-CoA oxygenase subunit PaaJ [Bacteroidota bacterium]WHZ09221.1 MAG: 1,2-phenylacetyl-CoA epoxidase, subunit D [Cytophagales bacterium]
MLTVQQIYTWLEEVKDPEIPVLSLVDLGVITSVTLENDVAKIEMTPTFVGCPAMEYMKEEVKSVLKKNGVPDVDVQISFKKAWSSDWISEKGKAALKKFGLAPPPPTQVFTELELLETVQCPRCDSLNTELKTPFGPTLCRSIYYCHTCKEAFELFKPI